jgi:SAM-dependent methyltransferase
MIRESAVSAQNEAGLRQLPRGGKSRAYGMEETRVMGSSEVRRIRMAYAKRARMHKSNADNPGRQRVLLERRIGLERVLKRLARPLSECRVLDVGCGTGSVLGWLNEQGVPAANLFGIDLLPERLKVARETYPAITFVEGNAEELPFPDHSFDLILVFTVFSSILDREMASNVACNIGRVLTDRGVVVWHDFRYPNPWNPDVRAMTKRRIRDLFPTFDLDLELIHLLPPIANRLGRLTNHIYPRLAAVPALRSHYFGVLAHRPMPKLKH